MLEAEIANIDDDITELQDKVWSLTLKNNNSIFFLVVPDELAQRQFTLIFTRN